MVEATALVREVDSLRGYVRTRLRGYPFEVDDTMQKIREIAWRKVDDFDPSLGTPGGFVYGIARAVTSKTLMRCAGGPLMVEFDDAVKGRPVPDGLDELIEGHEASRWVGLLADLCTRSEWELVVELARYDGDVARVAAETNMPLRTVRSTRDRVRVIVRTVRAALASIDAGFPVDPAEAIPDGSGLREVLPLLSTPDTSAARSLGVSPGVFRNRRSLVRRLLEAIERVTAAHAPARVAVD